jgi:hypothetical protein
MIGDEKVGPTGVRVRCKKCGNIITVKKTVEVAAKPAPPPAEQERDQTEVMMNPLAGIQVDTHQAPDMPTQMAASPANPFASGELDDEIGHAFDSVLGGNSGPISMPESSPTDPGNMPAAGGMAAGGLVPTGDDPDRLATKVMDLAQYASLTKAGASDLVSAASKGNGVESSTASDWYVAIADQQVGPMAVEGIRDRWNKGELSADSLVWRPGFTDWKPLSSISDLANVLAPVPKSKPAGATASGAQLPWEPMAASAGNGTDGTLSAAASGADSAPGGEPEWKPSAASAMASLVEEEIKALTKPTPKRGKEPEGVGEEKPTAKRESSGLLDLPDSTATSSAPDLTSPGRPPSDHLRPTSRDEVSQPSFQPARLDRQKSRSRAPVESTSSYRRDKSSRTLVLAIVGSALGVAGIISVVLIVALRPAAQPAVSVPVTPPAVTMPAPPPPEQKPAVVAQPAPTTATPTPPAPTTSPVAAAPTTTSTSATEAKTAPPPPRLTGKHEHIAREPKEHALAAARTEKEPPAPKEKEPPAEAPEPRTKSKVDKDFDDIFGPSKSSSAPSDDTEEAPAPKKKKKDIYVPPAVGQPAKESLSQGDIMGVVLSNKPQIASCVQQYQAKSPGEHGTIVMAWTIKGDGHTSAVHCNSDDFKGSALDKCLSTAIKGWVFPPFSGQPQNVPFPFKF